MTLPYRPEKDAIPPAAVAKEPNGKLPAHLLEKCGLGNFLMAGPAARAMRALVAAAERDGIRIATSGTYRTYDRQAVAFDGTNKALWSAPYDGRYVPENLWREYQATGRKWAVSNGREDVRTWKGTRWKRRVGTAGSAVPGTSNHGTGVAIDFSELNAQGQVVGLTQRTLNWLSANGPRFGYWNTVKSEPWHWCWCLGDQVPVSVLAVESSQRPPSPPPAPTPAPAPVAPAVGSYTVVSGDSYWAIAHKVLGNGARWKEISDLNNNKPLHPGVVLRLPGGATPPPAPKPERSYTVVSGDSYWGIAQRLLGNGGRWQELSKLNNDRALHPGMVIRVPAV
jgi:LysM repeat protein